MRPTNPMNTLYPSSHISGAPTSPDVVCMPGKIIRTAETCELGQSSATATIAFSSTEDFNKPDATAIITWKTMPEFIHAGVLVNLSLDKRNA